MFLLGKSVDEISETDILGLIENRIAESKILDYKREFTIDEQYSKKKAGFLADISAMYNTEGGCIIYGIEEKKDEEGKNTGIPDKLIELTIKNDDVLLGQIHDVTQSNTDPAITNLHPIFLTVNGLKILIIGVPKGIGMPVMITYNEVNKFYRRNSHGNYLVDTFELYNMFVNTNEIKDKADKFRWDRIFSLGNGSLFGNLNLVGQSVIHVIPYSFKDETFVDLNKIFVDQSNDDHYPYVSQNGDAIRPNRFNIDGLVTSIEEYGSVKLTSFNQYFRNGNIEIYSTDFYSASRDGKYGAFQANSFGIFIIKSLDRAFRVMKKLQKTPPLMVFISINMVKDAFLLRKDNGQVGQFTRGGIFLPPIYLPEFPVNENGIFGYLKPYLDIIWQAAGATSSPELRDYYGNR